MPSTSGILRRHAAPSEPLVVDSAQGCLVAPGRWPHGGRRHERLVGRDPPTGTLCVLDAAVTATHSMAHVMFGGLTRPAAGLARRLVDTHPDGVWTGVLLRLRFPSRWRWPSDGHQYWRSHGRPNAPDCSPGAAVTTATPDPDERV